MSENLSFPFQLLSKYLISQSAYVNDLRGVKRMSEQVKITFPDGTVKEFEQGVTTEEIASSISQV